MHTYKNNKNIVEMVESVSGLFFNVHEMKLEKPKHRPKTILFS